MSSDTATMTVEKGYKVTEIGVIPEEWEVSRLKDIAKLINGDRGRNYPSTIDLLSSGIPFVNAGHLVNGRIDLSDMNYISQVKFDKLSSGKFVRGDIIYCLRGTLGKNALVDQCYEGAIASSLVIFRPNNRTNSDFLYYLCNSEIEAEQRKNIDTGSAQPNLSASNVGRYLLPLPPLPEQEKIAEILSTVDEHIGETEDLIEKTATLKRGMMQKLLTRGIGHTEFKETEIGVIPEEWEVLPFSYHAQICYGKSQKEVESPVGEYPILGTGGEIGRSVSFLYDKPSVLIGRKGTINKPMYIEKPFWTVDTLFYSKIYDHTAPKWLYYYISSINLVRYNEATGVPSLSASAISRIPTPSPSLKEQRKIAEILSTVDNRIDAYRSKLEALNRLKKGLMQQLLTGRIRVRI